MTDTTAAGLPDPTPYLLDDEDEKVQLTIRRHHPIVLVPVFGLAGVVIVAVLALLLLGTPTLEMLFAGAVAIVAILLWVGYKWLHWSRTVLVVTNRRLFELVSLGIRRVTVLPVVRQSVVYRQSPLGNAVGYARVLVQTPTGDTLHDFKWLADAAMFRDAVTDVAA